MDARRRRADARVDDNCLVKRLPTRFALLGAAVTAATTAAVLTSRGWPARLPLHLALFLAAGALWAAALALLGRLPRARSDVAVLFAVAVALRVPAWVAAPAHSDDVFRYAWDGRVARAGIDPYRFPPAAPELAALRDGGAAVAGDFPTYERESARVTSGGGVFERINNRDLPTIYPPGAQLLFRLAASLPLPPIASLKLLLGACDLALLALLVAMLRQRGGDPRWAAAWGWSPLVAVELGQSGHLDALPLLGVVGALAAWDRGRPALAGAWLGLATATKWIAAPLLIGLRSPRAVVVAVAVVVLAALPYRDAGVAMLGSSGEFARRWRSNDGAYALVHAAAERAVCLALGAPAVPRDDGGPLCDKPLDIWPHWDLAAVITGRTYRAAIYPDELAAFAGRLVVALVIGGVLLGLLVARAPPLACAEWFLGALLLLTPALKPWYAAWLLPLAALSRRRAWIALAVLVPLGYLPLAAWMGGAPWRDPVWTRVVEHGAAWALLAADALRRRAERSAVAATGAKLDLDTPPATIGGP